MRFWRADGLGKVDLLHAVHSRHAFARHAHEGFAIGMVEAGAHGFAARGTNWLATPARSVIVVNPEDVHDGRPIGDSYSYRMLYVEPALVAEPTGGARVPFFPAAVVDDPDLACRIRALHRMLEAPGGSLALETGFLDLLSRLLERHGRHSPPLESSALRHRIPVRRARDYLEAHAGEAVTLSAVAAAAGISRYHLVRLFRREFGLPPHAWLMQCRLRLARRRLDAGEPPAAVAAALGFVDQSHLTRRFAAAFGVTPGRYRSSNPVQAEPRTRR